MAAYIFVTPAVVHPCRDVGEREHCPTDLA